MSDVDENEEVQKGVQLIPFRMRGTNLPEPLVTKVMETVTEACAKCALQKDIAEHIKRAVDQIPELNTIIGKGPWQCIVGKSFASAITHEKGHSIYFDLPVQGHTVLLFKSLGVQA